MTITTALILLIVTIVGVGVALAGVIIPASNRQSREIGGLRQQMNQEIGELRQQMNQQGQQINQIAQQVGRLSGLLVGLRGRPIMETPIDGN